MRNLAGHPEADHFIRSELVQAGVPDPIAAFRAAASTEQRDVPAHLADLALSEPDEERDLTTICNGSGGIDYSDGSDRTCPGCAACGPDEDQPEHAPPALTPDRLDELERMAREANERASKATPGPWRVVAPAMSAAIDVDANDGRYTFAVCKIETCSHRGSENGAFISAAREGVPALAAAVVALAAEVRRLQDALTSEWVERKEAEAARNEAVAEVRRLREEATRPAPRSPEEEEAMDIIHMAAESLRAKEPAPDNLSAIEKQAREDKAVAERATRRPWKWWTANSRRELRAEVGNRYPMVAHGQQHPHDRVIDIAISEADMALIERAVNGLEERADALLRLVKVVQKLRKREAFMAMCLRAGALPTSALASGEPPRAGEEPG